MADHSDDSLAHLLHLHGDELADWLLRPALYDEHYRPDAYLTRGELCAILSRFSDLKSGASSFQNIEHHWARDYVNICVSNGWIADGTEIDLNSYITVKVAANIIEKML